MTLAERTPLLTTILALPARRTSPEVVDAIIEHANSIPTMMKRSGAWDRGSVMAAHTILMVATKRPEYLAYRLSPWERGLDENTNGLIREYLPNGDTISGHLPYLDPIAEELHE